VDVFFFNLILISKGSKVVLRCLHMLSADRAQDMLMHMLRCLLPMAYCVATKKNGAGMELLVQLLVKLVYTMDLPQLLAVLEHSIMNTYSDGGMHLLMCTKLGALALAALLRRGHEEYMKDERVRTEEDNAQLILWAAACQKLTARMLGGMLSTVVYMHVQREMKRERERVPLGIGACWCLSCLLTSH
jgi:hypothetical protein